MTPTLEEIKRLIEDAIKWHRHDGVLTQLVYLTQLFGFRPKWAYLLDLGETSMTRLTNGTTVVNVFGANGAPFPFRVNAVYLISRDTTAGNITLKQAGNTVCTIAKGTVSGAMVGAASLSNQEYLRGDACSIVSSSGGNAVVMLQIEFPDN